MINLAPIFHHGLDLIKQYRIHGIAFLILVFSLPLFRVISTWAIAVSLLFALIVYFKGPRETLRVNWFLPTFFTYYLISSLLNGDDLSAMEKRLPLILIPFLVLLVMKTQNINFREQIYEWFIYGNLFAVAVCLIRAITRSVSSIDGILRFDSHSIKGTDFDFLTSSVMGGNYFFGDEFSYFLHPTYFGIFLVFAQVLIYYSSRPTWKKRVFHIFLYLLFFGSLFLLSSKAAILTSLLVTAYLIIGLRQNRFIKAVLIIIFAGVSILFFFINPRMRVFKDTFNTSQIIDPNARFGHDLRILSWDASIGIIRENWLFGVGEQNKIDALVGEYEKKGYVTPAQELFNSHNMYLDFMLGGGIIVLGLFLTGIGSLLVNAIRSNNVLLSSFLFIFAFNGLFENLLSRYWGIIFFSIFVSLLSMDWDMKRR